MNQLLRLWNTSSCRAGLAALLMAATLASCSTTGTPAPTENGKLRCQESGWQGWKEGIAAFQKKNYNRAAALFQSLSQHTRDEALRRSALYALACMRLETADSNETAKSALTLWTQWSASSPRPLRHEDPRLLTPFLTRIASTGMCDWNFENSKTAAASEAQSYDKLLRAKDRDLQQVRAKLEAKERETLMLKNQIFNLRHQIDSLEMIHREIQEKKREVSSP